MNTRLALLVSLLLGLVARPALAAPPVPWFEIFSQRFINDASGQPILDFGRLTAQGEFKHYNAVQLSPGTRIPAEALNQNLLPFSFLIAYNVLGPQALANFRLGRIVNVSGQDYFIMAVADKPKLDIGAVLNLSARGAVSPGGDPLVGGFVVDEHPRQVLLRGVGPILANLGVGAPLFNPVITLFRQGERAGFVSNDDWGLQANVSEIESAAASVGAFALPRTSKDAVVLVELPPGAYTVHVASRDGTGGTALLEVYMLP
jgi:hypothetical protein